MKASPLCVSTSFYLAQGCATELDSGHDAVTASVHSTKQPQQRLDAKTRLYSYHHYKPCQTIRYAFNLFPHCVGRAARL